MKFLGRLREVWHYGVGQHLANTSRAKCWSCHQPTDPSLNSRTCGRRSCDEAYDEFAVW